MPVFIASAIIDLASGIGIAIIFWKSRLKYFWAIAALLAVGVIVYSVWRSEPGVPEILPWSIRQLVYLFTGNAIIVLFAIFIGRRAGRLGAQLWLGPNLRQHAAMLWSADDMKPPRFRPV